MAAKDSKVTSKVQHLVHHSQFALVLPGVLLLTSAFLLAYRGATEGDRDLPLGAFLVNICLQMLPLIALKVRMYTCPDRVSLLPPVMVKTMLMHFCISFFRVTSQAFPGGSLTDKELVFDFAMLVGAVSILYFCFEFSLWPSYWMRHKDVINLVLLCAGVVCIFEAPMLLGREAMAYHRLLFTLANYCDIVTFMPVVFCLYQAESRDVCDVGVHVSEHSKSQAKYFFSYVVIFYSWDDIIDPCMNLTEEPIGLMAHAVHFMLLLDFAGFFMFQVANPAAVSAKHDSGEQLRGLLSEDVGPDDY